MQWLYASSTEADEQPGLGYFNETCDRFVSRTEKVPHVGWNSVIPASRSRLMAGISQDEYFYFTHSYRAPVTSDTVATASYIEPFAAAVERNHVMGVQFHPEKSGAAGLVVLRNFLEWKTGDGPC
jgi:glutamine amidotransferase